MKLENDEINVENMKSIDNCEIYLDRILVRWRRYWAVPDEQRPAIVDAGSDRVRREGAVYQRRRAVLRRRLLPPTTFWAEKYIINRENMKSIEKI